MSAAVCLLLLVMFACNESNDGKGAPPTTGAPQRFSLTLPAETGSVGYPTPYASIRGPGRVLTTYIFDTLIYFDVTGEMKPWLAESWRSSVDGKSWTFKLRKNVTFSDGTPLTADDVVFSFDYNLKGPGFAAQLGSVSTQAQGLTYIESVTAPGPDTVVITLASVHPSFLSDIGGHFGVAIVPKHVWSNVTDPVRFRDPSALIGSGPYRLEKFDLSTNSFDFVANDAFFLGKPAVRELKFIPVSDALQALAGGLVDVAGSADVLIPQVQFDALSKQFKVYTAPAEGGLFMSFNGSKGFPYNEVSFRQAVLYGIDRNDMIQRLLGGRGSPGPGGGLGPGNPFFNKNLATYPFDVSKAKALLDQLGLRDRNGDGARDMPDGTPFRISLSTSSTDVPAAELVKEYLRAVGLDLGIDSVDQATSDARGSSGSYTVAMQHFGGLSGDPSGLVTQFSSTSTSTAFARVFGYGNSTFDALAAEQATTLDVGKRTQIVNQMQAILATDLPQFALYFPQQVFFQGPTKFGGFGFTPGCRPCGIAGNKQMLVTGSAAPAPGNP